MTPGEGTQAAEPASPSTRAAEVGVSGIVELAALSDELGRRDVADRLRAAVARASRAATIVCVVGEFKQGKSSLVNALLGFDVCPVDDDLATSAMTLVRYGDAPSVHVRRREDGRLLVEPIEPETLRDWVTESGNPDNRRGLERVEVAVPHPALRGGLAIVDTPGAGGLATGTGAATLAFLPFADGLVFVTDATSELTAPELDFLGEAARRCPAVIVAVTKIDVAAHWRRIAELDRDHLRAVTQAVPVVPVSAQLRAIAAHLRDESLAEESGVPELWRLVDEAITGPAREVAATRGVTESRAVADELTAALETELAALRNPGGVAGSTAALAEATARLEHLRGPGSRWATVFADGMTDVSNQVTHRLRATMREIGRRFDERVDELKSPADWTAMGAALAGEVSEAVAAVWREMQAGTERVRGDVAAVLREEAIDARDGGADRHAVLDIASLWRGPQLDPEGALAKRVVGDALTGLRGAQSGMLLFGMLGGLLPAAVGAVVLAAPVTLGLGVAFAGSQLMDANKRKLTQRRQKVKQAVRQFLDDVQFQVGNELADSLRAQQREVRDEFTDRVAELNRTLAETIRRATSAAEQDEATRHRRAVETEAALERIARIRARLSATP